MTPKRVMPLAIACSLLGVEPARGEYRAVSIQVTRDKDSNSRVTISSDLKEEQKQSVTVDEACAVVKKMSGRSGVGVAVVMDRKLEESDDGKKLLKAISDNWWLDRVHLGPELPPGWPKVWPAFPPGEK